MDRAARLDLAVRTRLALIEADRTRERTASLDRQYVPVARAIEEYVGRHGRDADPFDDFDTFVGLIVRHGGTDLGREDVLAATEQYVQRAAAASEAAEATRAGGGDGRPSEDGAQMGGLLAEAVRCGARSQAQRVRCQG